jgi:hypothetical protein
MDLSEKIGVRGEVKIEEFNADGKKTNEWLLKNCIMDYGRCILPLVLAGPSALPANFPGRTVPYVSKVKYGFGRPLGAGATENTDNKGITEKFKNVVDPDGALSSDINVAETDAGSAICTVASDVLQGQEQSIQSVAPYYLRLRAGLHKPYTFQLSENSPFNPELIRGNTEFDGRWVNPFRPIELQEYASGYQKNFPLPPQSVINNEEYYWYGGATPSSADDLVEDLKNNLPQFGEFEWSVTFKSFLDASARVVETVDNNQFVSDDGLSFDINEIGLFSDFTRTDNWVTLNNRSYPLNPMLAMRYTPTIRKKRLFSLQISWSIIF